MATTSNTITATAGQTEFSFSFPYLKKESIKVTIDTVATTAFTIPDNNPTTVILNSGATAGQVIKIFRLTSTEAVPAAFFAGGAIRSKDLNNNFDSILYITQERENQTDEIIQGGIADGSITSSKLANNSVGTAALIDGGVATVDLADDAVTTPKIVNDAVTTAKIVNDAVSTPKIIDDAVTTVKIVNAAVTTAKIADANVTTAKIADDAVTTNKIANSSVNADKLATTVILLPTGAITAFGGSTAPTGYLECNGQTTAGYPALAAVVGANVPDLRGEFVRGWDNSKGTDNGRSLGSLQYATATRQWMSDAQGGDSSSTSVNRYVGQQFASEDSIGLANFNGTRKQPNGTTTTGSTTDNASLGGLDNAINAADKWITYRPRNVALMYIIKT